MTNKNSNIFRIYFRGTNMLYRKNNINFRYECINGTGSFIAQKLIEQYPYLFTIYKCHDK